MIVSDIITRVRRKFGDESAVQVTDADIIRWVNDGQRKIVLKNEDLLQVTSTADSVVGQQEYTLPANLLILKFVQFKGAGQTSYIKLDGLTMAEFNQYIDGWSDGAQAKGNPSVYTVHANKFIVYPTPADAVTAAFKIYYNRTPVDVTAVGDTPDLPLLYHDTLMSYCMREAYELDEDPDSAAGEATKIAEDIDLLRGREDWKVQDSYPTVTVLNEDNW